MRTVFIHISFLLLLVSCNNHLAEKPVWTNETAILSFPDFALTFKSDQKNWNASLLTFTQPVPLTIQYNDTGFTVLTNRKAGITEGNAMICISKGKQYFYYPYYIFIFYIILFKFIYIIQKIFKLF